MNEQKKEASSRPTYYCLFRGGKETTMVGESLPTKLLTDYYYLLLSITKTAIIMCLFSLPHNIMIPINNNIITTQKKIKM